MEASNSLSFRDSFPKFDQMSDIQIYKPHLKPKFIFISRMKYIHDEIPYFFGQKSQ